MRKIIRVLKTSVLVLLLAVGICTAEKHPPKQEVVSEKYPRLFTGALTYATLGSLSEGVLLKADGVTITMNDLTRIIDREYSYFRDEIRKNAFFVLEQEATDKLLLILAKKKGDPGGNGNKKLVRDYIERKTEDIEVSEAEIKKFYKKNKSSFPGASLDQIKEYIRSFVLEEKKQKKIDTVIRNIGKKIPITLSASWIKKQAAFANDNQVDRARESGKPSVVIFSGASCCGPDRTRPIIESVRERYGEKLNVVYLEVRQNQILAARYRVRSIPTVFFFDKHGAEYSRTTGLTSAKDIDETLSDMGVE